MISLRRALTALTFKSPTGILLQSRSFIRTTTFQSHTRLPVELPSDVERFGLSAREVEEIREWYRTFDVETLPKSAFDITYARSSGPGGQHVNKTNSKACVRVDLNDPNLRRAMHPRVLEAMRKSFYATKSGELLIKSDEGRSALANTSTCMRKLAQLITTAIKLPGVTSEAQKERVVQLKKKAKEAIKITKQFNSNKKKSRKGGSSNDY